MYPVEVIAYAFVKKGIEEDNPVTQMKFQKLIYFAQGLHLAQGCGPLINEDFQAWKYGPVVPKLYQAYKFYGSNPITDLRHLFWLNDKEQERLEIEVEKLDKKAKNTINITWETLKKANAVRLSAWTHEVGSPWHKYYIEGAENIEIPNKDIESYFKSQFVNQE